MTDMIVSGAGTSAVNGTYVEGDYYSNPGYRMQSSQSETGYFYLVMWSDKWVIASYGYKEAGFIDVYYTRYYESVDNTATPDLVATWTAVNFGSAPAPTVTAASSSQNLTLTCAAGSYSLTGTAATLTVQRNYGLSCGS